MKTKKELLESDHFCILPFVHTCVWTDGRVIPCCINQDYVLGNSKTEKLNDIFSNNNKKLVDLRKKMLEGPNLPSSCYRCSVPEKTYNALSYRYFSNKHYGHLIENLDFDENGVVKENKISLWDVRFSNLCNLKCRTCDNINSSKIAEEEKSTPVLQKAFNDSTEFFNFFINNIDYIEEIYFCGGEPLLLEEHYKILDILIEHKKFNLVLRYNTNCTKLVFKGKNVVTDYWKFFKTVRIAASLDAGWEQLSYIRHGSDWDKILNNLYLIKETCPHVNIQLCPTIGILNVFHFDKLHKFLVKENIVNINSVYFNILNYPNYFSITALPDTLKKQVETYWNDYAMTMKEMGAKDELIQEIYKVITYMFSKNEINELENFKKNIKQKDIIRNENFKELFSELKDLYYE